MSQTRYRRSCTRPLWAAVFAAALAACSDDTADSLRGTPITPPGTDDDAGADAGDIGSNPRGAPFEAVGPQVYVPRVKNLMTGLAATDAEVQAVVKDANAFRGLVDQWMGLPQFQERMLDFFRNAFQQNQVVFNTLLQNAGFNNFQINTTYAHQLERNIMDSFPMTAWELVKAGRPLTDAVGTNSMMMTTAMMSVLSYFDDVNISDANKTTNRLAARNAITQFVVDPNSTVALSDSLNPSSPNYMIWHMPATFTGCTPTPVTHTGNAMYQDLFTFLFGRLAYPPCVPNNNQTNFGSQFADTDFSDWRMVTLNATDGTTPNTTPIFYDIIKMRASSTMALHTKRIGYFGTLAFDANWGTNSSNEARVTANQALIVGIGQSINGENVTVSFPMNSNDTQHAANPACTGCHSQVDPLKQYFRQSYTYSYHDQTDTAQMNQPAGFNIDGVNANGSGVGDLAKTMASHPRLPLAWAQKLYFWASSTPALEDDPELLRIADVFKQANFDFKALAREVFSSPLLTLAGPTKTTTTNGVILSITRRDQFCAALSNRMGLPDVCGMLAVKQSTQQAQIAQRALLMPVDTYYRAYALPSYPTDPDLFFRDSVESICRLVGDQVIDVTTGTSKYSSKQSDTAIADFVATVMAIPPSDGRSAQALAILKDNFTAAQQQGGANATDALKSTFTLACIAPTSVVLGL